MADSIVFSPANPHFFQPMLKGFNTHLSIPKAFYTKYLEGIEEGNVAELRSSASEITWTIKIEGRRLTQGWEKFAEAHSLQVGDMLFFRHDGNLVFHVTILGPSCCEIPYENNVKEEIDSEKLTGNDMNLKKNPTRSYLPKGFTTLNGLSKLCNEIILIDENGRSSILELRYDKTFNRFRVRRGWRAFCYTNGHKTGCVLRLISVQNGIKPIIRIFPFEMNEDDIGNHSKNDNPDVEHECAKENKNFGSLSLSNNSSFAISVTVCNLREDRLILPKRFPRSNMLNERLHDIILMNKHGRSWTLRLNYRKSSSQFYITKGWKSFCETNGQEAGCSFLFELVRNRTDLVLLMSAEDSTRTAFSDNPVGPKME